MPWKEEHWRRKAWDDFLGDDSRLLPALPADSPRDGWGWIFGRLCRPGRGWWWLSFWVSGCEEQAAVRVMARATAPASPGYQGYQHFPAQLLFVLAPSPWVCWHSQLGSPGSEECVWFTCWTLWPRKNLIPAWEDLHVYVLTAQTFFYDFFHFSYLRKWGLVSLLHSFSRCVYLGCPRDKQAKLLPHSRC